ncbi:MAG TPA: hypothetical protein PK778_03035 [Bacillota bacterium]|nr:hypothetical protein [Bacillota bacterium]
MKRPTRLLLLAAVLACLCGAVSCAPGEPKWGVLSAENALVGSRLYHAARVSDTFQYIDLGDVPGGQQTIEPKVACTVKGCAHSDDSCPAYIRGLTCWARDPKPGSHKLWYAQMRTYFDAELKKGVRHTVIACLKPQSGETATVLWDWKYAIDQLLLYGEEIYFLSKNEEGTHDIWVMPQSGGEPKLFVQAHGADIIMLGMEDGVLYYMSEDGGVFRAPRNSGAAQPERILTCEMPTGIFVYGGYIYYPVRYKGAPEYELLPAAETDENGEPIKPAVAVNCYDYYRIKVTGGEPKPVITGVQATIGSLISEGRLYCPAWDFEYYGSVMSEGGATYYFSRSSGKVWAADLSGGQSAELIMSPSKYGYAGIDIAAIYAVTDKYCFLKLYDTLAAYQTGEEIKPRYALLEKESGKISTVGFDSRYAS